MHHADSCMIRGPIDKLEFLQGWPENFPNDNTIKIFIFGYLATALNVVNSWHIKARCHFISSQWRINIKAIKVFFSIIDIL